MTTNDLYTLIGQLRVQVSDLQARVDELETFGGSINGPDVVYAQEGVPLWSARSWPSSQYQNLIAYDAGGTAYRFQPSSVEGNPSFEIVPADVLVSSDGKWWRPRVIVTEGHYNLADPEEVA